MTILNDVYLDGLLLWSGASAVSIRTGPRKKLHVQTSRKVLHSSRGVWKQPDIELITEFYCEVLTHRSPRLCLPAPVHPPLSLFCGRVSLSSPGFRAPMFELGGFSPRPWSAYSAFRCGLASPVQRSRRKERIGASSAASALRSSEFGEHYLQDCPRAFWTTRARSRSTSKKFSTTTPYGGLNPTVRLYKGPVRAASQVVCAVARSRRMPSRAASACGRCK